jgi:basic amino acid/polyamine antiporter, APA family
MSPESLSRQLTLPAATALVVGQVIAVGIFLTPGTIIRTLASPLWVLVIWALIGGMAICGALCYGALAARYPGAVYRMIQRPVATPAGTHPEVQP